mgnify:CR=1 FL=1
MGGQKCRRRSSRIFCDSSGAERAPLPVPGTRTHAQRQPSRRKQLDRSTQVPGAERAPLPVPGTWTHAQRQPSRRKQLDRSTQVPGAVSTAIAWTQSTGNPLSSCAKISLCGNLTDE